MGKTERLILQGVAEYIVNVFVARSSDSPMPKHIYCSQLSIIC